MPNTAIQLWNKENVWHWKLTNYRCYNKNKTDCFNWLGYDGEQILILDIENLTQYIYKYQSYGNWHFALMQNFQTIIGNKCVAVLIHGMSM
jgi:hypothetical protein